MDPAGRRSELEPLRQRNSADQIYQRSAEVESQIHDALDLGRADLIARARIADVSSSAYLKEECLAYLVRDAWRREDLDRLNTTTELLLARCVRWIRAGFFNLGTAEQDVDDLAGELIEALITALTSSDDRGDFYQVRFWWALKLDLLNIEARYHRAMKHHRRNVGLSDPVAGTSAADNEPGAALEEVLRSRDDVARRVEGRLFIAEALASIRDPRHREALALHYLEEWSIETKDPSAPSISARFGVSARTVHAWLKQAKAELTAWYTANN